jgi:hypothetical protein
MKNLFIVFALLTAVVIACTSSDYYVKGRKEGGKVVLAPEDAGGTQQIMLELDPVTGELSVPSGKVLVVDDLKGTDGGPAPGVIPVGGMFMHAVATSWSLPNLCPTGQKAPACGQTVDNVVKDGFMIANGQLVPAGQGLAEDTVLPDMTDHFARGGTSISLTPAGADEFTVTTAELPAHGHGDTFSALMVPSQFEHSHSDTFSVGADNISTNRTVSVSHSVSGTFASTIHRHLTGRHNSDNTADLIDAAGNWRGIVGGFTWTRNGFYVGGADLVGGGAYGYYTDTGSVYNSAASGTGGNGFASVSNGTPSGSMTHGTFEHSHSDDFSATITAGNFEHSHSDTFSVDSSPAATNNVDTVPSHLTIVYLIRVK